MTRIGTITLLLDLVLIRDQAIMQFGLIWLTWSARTTSWSTKATLRSTKTTTWTTVSYRILEKTFHSLRKTTLKSSAEPFQPMLMHSSQLPEVSSNKQIGHIEVLAYHLFQFWPSSGQKMMIFTPLITTRIITQMILFRYESYHMTQFNTSNKTKLFNEIANEIYSKNFNMYIWYGTKFQAKK